MTGFLADLTGSFATSAAQNPTVAVMEAAYAHARLDVRYINCEVPPERLGDAVRGAIGMGWLGFNCSIPHKVAILDYLDAMAPSAGIIGAVNCVINRDGHLTGENTDGQGFVRSLRTVIDPTGRDMVVLGAGGAARAIAVESALAGARSVTIVNRTPERGEELRGARAHRGRQVGRDDAAEGPAGEAADPCPGGLGAALVDEGADDGGHEQPAGDGGRYE